MRLVRSSALLAGLALVLAGHAGAEASTQQVLLPGPSPFPTTSPPLVAQGSPGRNFLPFGIRATTAQLVTAGVDERGRVVSVIARQRIVLRGKGDYRLLVGAPLQEVRAGPGSDSEPGMRTGQILWAGFSPGRRVLAAETTLRPAAAAPFLPLRVALARAGNGWSLTVTNVTPVAELGYAGTVRPREIARLLDQTRRQARAALRLSPAYATFAGLVRTRKQPVRIEAPFRVEGELRVGGGSPVSFARTLGDGRPLSLRVAARGAGAPKLRLVARPTPVERLLRPPGTATWAAAARRRGIPGAALLERLIDTRMRLVRADQFQAFLSNPDSNGRNRTVYVYETTAAPRATTAPPRGRSSGNALLVALVVVGAIAAAGVTAVAWAHS